MVYVSATHIHTALGYSRDVWNKAVMLIGNPTAITARLPNDNKDRWQTQRGYELEATLLWLQTRVPSFNGKHESKLRGMAQEPVR